jgi:hypothetical protein
LSLDWSGEDVFEVVDEGFDALQLGPLRAVLEHIPVVEVGLGGQRYERRPGGRHLVGEARPGDESDVVATLDEPLGDRQ